MEQPALIPHLFRTEFSKITAVLCRHFGIAFMDTASDIAGDTFLSALETWPYKGIPENPVAWLYTVAKNKARNYIQRQHLLTGTIVPALQHAAITATDAATDIDLSEKNIHDSQLQMLFAICHPLIPQEAQIGLALRILCGFGIEEIAHAFVSNKATINKRLFRARETLRQHNVQLAFPPAKEIESRLDTVLTTLYLLYNEGYYSESRDSILREDLCLEAMRLAYLLAAYEPANVPAVQALLSLMCFHSSRFAARKDDRGELVLYRDQDETLWDRELIARGAWYLHQASGGPYVSRYHIEAGIAYWHTVKEDSPEKWEKVLQLYNRLLQVKYTPVAALNRTYALYKVHGAAAAIQEAEKLQLNSNHYYHTLLGVLYRHTDPEKAQLHLQQAFKLAVTETDRQTIKKKLDEQEDIL